MGVDQNDPFQSGFGQGAKGFCLLFNFLSDRLGDVRKKGA